MSAVEIALQTYGYHLTPLIAEEKWVAVNMQNYIGTDEDIHRGILFANPKECESFLAKGQLTVTEFIRHHNTLATSGLWEWTDPDFESALQTTVGDKFFNHMGKLDMEKLNDLVATSLKQNVKYFDYPTECKLRKLLQKEKVDGWEGRDAREHLRSQREFYKKWGKNLFGEIMIEAPGDDTPRENTTETVVMTVSSQATRHYAEIFWVVCGMIIFLVY
jgi:hypothetical protein